MKQSPTRRFAKKPLAVGITTALLFAGLPQASATNFELGDFDIRFNSTFSVGASWRVENRNWNDNVGKSNNINNGFDLSNYHPAMNPSPD